MLIRTINNSFFNWKEVMIDQNYCSVRRDFPHQEPNQINQTNQNQKHWIQIKVLLVAYPNIIIEN